MKAIILAAGKGTRINTGSIIVPKPLYSVGRKALIEHVILNLKQAGITEFVVIVGFMSEHIKDYLKDGTELGVKISYVYNSEFERELGVSAAVCKKAVPEENFILSMADHIVDPEVIKQLIQKGQNCNDCILCIDRKLEVVNNIEDATKVLTEDNCIVDINKKLINFDAVDCGLFFMTPQIFKHLETAQGRREDTLTEGIQEYIKHNSFTVFDIGDGKWVEVDTRSDLLICEELIEQMGWRKDGEENI